MQLEKIDDFSTFKKNPIHYYSIYNHLSEQFYLFSFLYPPPLSFPSRSVHLERVHKLYQSAQAC